MTRTLRLMIPVLLATIAGDGAARAPDGARGAGPVWLAPGVVTTAVTTRDAAFRPDGRELCFTMAAPGYAQAVICVSRRDGDRWTEPEAAPFSGDARWVDLEPAFAPDGRSLYFTSTRNAAGDGADDADLWRVARRSDGWGEPEPVGAPVNSGLQEYYPSLTAGGTLYFTRADSSGRINSIWRSRPDGHGGFVTPERLPAQVNCGTTRFNAWVAPDESRLVLSVVGLPGNHGLADYWQVRRRADDTWAEPENLGARVNAGLGRAWSCTETPGGGTFVYMAAPAGDDPWPRSWGVLQARAGAPGAAGGIALLAVDALDAAGPGTAALAPSVTPVPFPEVRGPWLGQDPPGREPELFAPGLLSTGLHERDVLVLPSGREIWYGLMDLGILTVMSTRLVDGVWTEPRPVPFHDDPEFACFEPTLSADGSRVFFLSNRAAPGQEQGEGWANQNIFTARRTADGWTGATALPPPVTSDEAEYFPSLAADGTLYFTREDAAGAAIWAAEPEGDGFAAPHRLPPAVNRTGRVFNATVAPDEGWIIACVGDDPANLGAIDYWISFRGDDGAWRQAVNLGTRFNGPDTRAASVSLAPDGSVLFFSSRREVGEPFPDHRVTPAELRRRRGEPGCGSADLWWIDAGVLADYQL